MFRQKAIDVSYRDLSESDGASGPEKASRIDPPGISKWPQSSRRGVLAGGFAFCCAILGCCPEVKAEPIRRQRFVCSVPDTAPYPSPLTFSPEDGDGSNLNFAPEQHDLVFTPYGTAFASDAWRADDSPLSNGGKIVLGVGFLDGVDTQKAAVIRTANKWLAQGLASRLIFDFGQPLSSCQIRVTFSVNDNWSAIGRKALEIQNNYTLSLDNVEEAAILHEFGHVLGLQHEHQYPGAIRWHEANVIADMRESAGWSEKETKDNILKKLGPTARCIGDQKFNRSSIMMYPIPDGWADYSDKHGKWTPLVVDLVEEISSRDIACVKGLYKL